MGLYHPSENDPREYPTPRETVVSPEFGRLLGGPSGNLLSPFGPRLASRRGASRFDQAQGGAA